MVYLRLSLHFRNWWIAECFDLVSIVKSLRRSHQIASLVYWMLDRHRLSSFRYFQRVWSCNGSSSLGLGSAEVLWLTRRRCHLGLLICQGSEDLSKCRGASSTLTNQDKRSHSVANDLSSGHLVGKGREPRATDQDLFYSLDLVWILTSRWSHQIDWGWRTSLGWIQMVHIPESYLNWRICSNHRMLVESLSA